MPTVYAAPAMELEEANQRLQAQLEAQHQQAAEANQRHEAQIAQLQSRNQMNLTCLVMSINLIHSGR